VAGALGVSRTPVREAFLRLSAEGLLRLYPKRGALVLPVTEREIHEVIQARALTEGWATVQAARAAADADLVARLRDLVAEQDSALRLGQGRAFQLADRAFHETIVLAAGNEIISRWHEALRDRQLRHGTVALTSDGDRARRIIDEHRTIASMIETADAEGVAGLVERHLAASLTAALAAAGGPGRSHPGRIRRT
jgi:DNA-binding GntR family transcriptional regulator